jgi:serine/threonine protein kinase
MAGVNDTIGNYRLLKELASGTYGRVYQAEHIILTNRTVAIKLLQGAHLNSLKDREDFLQEARLLEMLKHPYILPIIDVGIHEGFPYLVVEYAPNGSLRNYLQQRSIQQFQEEEIYAILSQVGQALQHAHEEHIIHRDLKPENILFNAKREALLADFGIATVLSTMTINYNVTVIGTPAYMAPEQFRGAVCKESDQYALGCIAYELYTGQKPFLASDLATFMFQHLMENPIAPTSINPSLPTHIERAILKAMAKERTERHADISAFITALQSPDITQTKKSDRSNTDTSTKSRMRSSSISSADQKSKEQWLDQAIVYQKAKQHAKAIVAIDHAIRLDPTYADAHMCKGDVFYTLGRHQEALAAYEQAIKHNPKDTFAHNNRGNVLYELGLYEEALVAYEQDASRSPITCPMAHRRLATGCVRPWWRKKDRTGAKGQARLFLMDWNAWKKPGRRVISLSWRASPTAGRSGTTTFQPLVCPA